MISSNRSLYLIAFSAPSSSSVSKLRNWFSPDGRKMKKLANRVVPGDAITTNDFKTYMTVSVLLVAAAFLAILLPSERATKLDPVDTLRSE
jgi:ABC-type lipoprotein release transport system permease subunit